MLKYCKSQMSSLICSSKVLQISGERDVGMPKAMAATVATDATGYTAAPATDPSLDISLEVGDREDEKEREGMGGFESMEELIAVPHLKFAKQKVRCCCSILFLRRR